MDYSNKQTKCILRIQEFMEISNILSKMYIEFDDKELSINNITDKNRVYKIYCSSVYNLLDAIKQSKDIFGLCRKYNEFEEFINKEYIAIDEKYYENKKYKSNFYKIIKTIRNQVNHFNRDDEDANMLFEIYIDFKLIEELRLIVNDIFNEIYNKLDKNKIKSIIISKPKIQYSFDMFNNKLSLVEQKVNTSENEIDKIFFKENEESIKILKDYFNPNNLINLLSNDEETIKKYDLMDNRMDEMFNQQLDYIDKNGTSQQKEAIKLIKNFTNSDIKTKNNYDKYLKKLVEDLTNLVEKYNKND